MPDTDDEGLLGHEYSRTLNRHGDWKLVKVNSLRPNISDPRQDLGRGVGAHKYLDNWWARQDSNLRPTDYESVV